MKQSSSPNEGERKDNQQQEVHNPQQHVHDQQNNFIEYLLGHGDFSTDVVDQLTEMVSLDQMSAVIWTCQELHNADLTLYVPPNEWNDGDDVRKMFTIMTATQTTKWIGRIDTSKVTKMMFGEKNYYNSDRPTIVTDAWLHFTASGKFPLLTSLDLSWCNNITETGITELVRGCPQITNLNFTRCDWVTDASVTTLSSEFTRMTELHLALCNITDASVLALLNGCPKLNTLNLDGCVKITGTCL